MGECRCRGVDHDLTDGFDTKRTAWLVAGFKFYIDPAHIQTGRDLVLHKAVLCDFSLCVVSHIFIECHADSLADTAFRLYSCKGWIDRDTAVDHRLIIKDLDASRLFIQLDLYHSDHVRRRGYRGRIRGCHIHRNRIVDLRFCGNIRKTDGLFAVGQVNFLTVKIDFFRFTLKHAGTDLFDIFPQLQCRILRCHSCHISGGRCI